MVKIKIAICALLAAAAFSACSSGPDVIYRPYPQILPQHVTKLAVRPFVNQTEVFGVEDKLNYQLTQEFMRDGTYPLVPERDANGVVVGEIRRYILTPIQYDAAMVPTAYKLDVLLRVRFYDKQANTYLWEEPALQGTQVYSAPTLPGGMTEDQARTAIWGVLAKDIIKRTLLGFGSISSQSNRRISYTDPVAVSTAAPAAPK